VDQGDGTIYDTVLNVFWMADASYVMTSGYDADALMGRTGGVAWADQLVFAGYDDWRLPEMDVNGGAMAIWAVRDGPAPVSGPSTPFLLTLVDGIGVSGMRRLRSMREDVRAVKQIEAGAPARERSLRARADPGSP
jgi:hypothetical protein